MKKYYNINPNPNPSTFLKCDIFMTIYFVVNVQKKASEEKKLYFLISQVQNSPSNKYP